MNLEFDQKDNIHLYSQRSISIATTFGGPLAAGILARQNFINLGKEDLGKKSLIIGIGATILLLVGILLVPESYLDKVPNAIIPVIYSAITYFIIDRVQGKNLKEHKENNRPFYSAWKAIGIGAMCSFILLTGIFGIIYLSPDEFDTARFDSGIAKFKENEEKALFLFTMFDTSAPDDIINYIDKVGLPAWKENIIIIDDLDNIGGLDDQLKKQNDILREYSKTEY